MSSLARLRHLALVAMTIALVTACKHTPPEPFFKDSIQTATAKVETVDAVTRLVALRTPQGERLWVTAGPEVRNFSQIKVGDSVNVQYYRAIAAEVRPKGAVSLTQESALASYSVATGARPAGAVGHMMVETVKIQSTDISANTVTFLRQDGSVHRVTVASPEGQLFIKGLRSGDDVDVAYAEAVAVAVVPAH